MPESTTTSAWRSPLPTEALDKAGLNRQHVFDLAGLPTELLAPLAALPHEKQLILIGHAGRRLWQCVTAAAIGGEHPIDTYSRQMVGQWLARVAPASRWRFVFPDAPGAAPAAGPIGLQALGREAGWHHAAPFMLGIDAAWGTWFAYRAVVLADTDFAPTLQARSAHPCSTCTTRACISACPAHALDGGRFDFAACSHWRLQPDSPCAWRCAARLACPVGAQHRYDEAQMRHAGTLSLQALKKHR